MKYVHLSKIILLYMKRLICLALLVISSSYCFSQNQIFIGTKSYEATQSWKFLPAKRTFSDDEINIQIGKSSKGGIIMISVASEFGRASINSSIFIY